MKRFINLSTLLTFLVTLSIGLTYILLFSHHTLTNFLIPQKEITTELAGENNYQAQHREAFEYFEPTQGIIRTNNKNYILNDYLIIQQMNEELVKEALEISDFVLIDHLPDLEQDHLELSFDNYIPLKLFQSLVDLPDNFDENFIFNKLLMTTSQDREMYLLDSRQQVYLKVDTPREAFFNKIMELANEGQKHWVEAKRFDFLDGTTYLPKHGITVTSEVYTVEKIPDSVLLGRVFSGPYNMDDGINPGVKNYQDLNNTLRLDTRHQSMSLRTSIVNRDNQETLTQRYQRELELLDTYDYWMSDVRYLARDENRATVRRYLKGLPIFSSPDSFIDYGSMKLESYWEDGTQVSNLLIPTNVFQIHIDTLSKPVRLDNYEEIIQQLIEAEIDLEIIDRIFIGYQWISEDEDMKKVELIPQWYVSIDKKNRTLKELIGEE